ncbi:MAG: hypothetical protein AAB290_06135 [Candidatus Eisenbacteria bacterium]
MRKFVAMTMVALLALTLALAVVGCAQKAEETTTTPAETSMPPAETMPDTAVADTSMGH